jgi:hypothetical protein
VLLLVALCWQVCGWVSWSLGLWLWLWLYVRGTRACCVRQASVLLLARLGCTCYGALCVVIVIVSWLGLFIVVVLACCDVGCLLIRIDLLIYCLLVVANYLLKSALIQVCHFITHYTTITTNTTNRSSCSSNKTQQNNNKTITTTPKFINKPDPKLSQLTSSPTPQLWHTLLQAHRVVRQYLSVCQVRKSK